jgi:hypothetical protein
MIITLVRTWVICSNIMPRELIAEEIKFIIVAESDGLGLHRYNGLIWEIPAKLPTV